MKFTDTLVTDGAIRRTADGFAILDARVARAGNVQSYRGSELGFTDKDVIRVFRPEEAVFSKDAIKTYAGVPVTIGHPRENVTEKTWRDVAVGEVGDEVLRDGEFVRVPMTLRDGSAIAQVESGVRELSMGYDAQLEFRDGVTPAGEPYDAVMSGFRMNHVAIVPKARGGEELRIGDHAGGDSWGASPVTIADRKGSEMSDIKLRTVVVGDEAVNTTDEGARAIEKLKAEVGARDAKIAATDKAHTDAIAAKDEEIGKLKADLKTAQDAAKIDVDKLVADRAELVEAVKAIDAKIETGGKSDADLRKAAVAAKLGDELVKDASDAEILGMFKAVAKDAKGGDPVADVIRTGIKPAVTDAATQAQDAWDKGITDLNAWRKEA